MPGAALAHPHAKLPCFAAMRIESGGQPRLPLAVVGTPPHCPGAGMPVYTEKLPGRAARDRWTSEGPMETFDYVIAGGGTAACILAARLTEDGTTTVCLLEAGPPDSNPYIRIPAGFMKTLYNPAVTWNLTHEPCEGTAGRRVYAGQGRTLGGSSSINGMIYNRGQAADYDGWAQRGNRGWAYADILPYFKRTERRIGPGGEKPGDDRLRGRDGALPVTTTRWQHPLLDAFIAAAVESGVPLNEDYNGADQFGVCRVQSAILLGKRYSTATAFLHPARGRANLSVRTNALVTRITLEGRRATGLIYRRDDGSVASLAARRSVIVSAGALHSPKLLQLSGIGPADLLREHGIAVAHDLPGVGSNLGDHYGARVVARVKNTDSLNNRVKGARLLFEGVKWALGQPSALSNSPGVIHAFCKSDPGLDNPDLNLTFMPASFKAGVLGVLDDVAGMTCAASISRPESTGTVSIDSSNPLAPPILRPNYFSTENDRRRGVIGVKTVRRIFRAAAFRDYLDTETLPGADVRTDEDLLAFLRGNAGSGWHYNGTCKMGPEGDAMAVVNDQLAVRGIDGLHIADASVMPCTPSGNTMAPVMMIAEKAADMLLGKQALPRAEI